MIKTSDVSKLALTDTEVPEEANEHGLLESCFVDHAQYFLTLIQATLQP